MKIEEISVHPEFIWVLPDRDKKGVSGVAVGDAPSERGEGAIVKVGGVAADYYFKNGRALTVGGRAMFELNRAAVVSVGGVAYRAVHYLAIQAFC